MDLQLSKDYIFLVQEKASQLYLKLQVLMAQAIQLWVFCIMATKEVAEVFHPLAMEVKTKMAKDLETSGVAQNVEIHVLPWNVSPCQSCTLMDP